MCHVGAVDNSEVSTASGVANISIALAPEDIFLEQPFDGPTANLSAGQYRRILITSTHTGELLYRRMAVI